MRGRTFKTIALMLALSTLEVGCSGSDAGSPAALVDRVEEMNSQMLAGSSTYELLSVSCQAEWPRPKWNDLVKAAAERTNQGIALDEIEVISVETRNMQDQQAEARPVLVDGDGQPLTNSPPWEFWVKEDGEWRSTNCPPGPGKSGDSTVVTDTSSSDAPGEG